MEDLPGWVIIEWSKANGYVKGVNFPANMLWARALEDAGRLLGRCDWTEKAKAVRERTPYEGDTYINQLCQYAIDADYSLARKSHEWLMEHPTWPTEWKQHSIKMAWADWMWTGDTRSLAKYYDRLQKKLVGNYPRRDIVDWPVAERDGFVMTNSNAVVDAFNCRNLKEMADIAADRMERKCARGSCGPA